jgi:tRNA A-37 threonylcarbamoyl transferase component Bud32
MDADRARIRELAESARRLPVAERKAFLDGFRLDAALRREVESLLAADVTRVWKPADGPAAAEAPTEVPVAGDAGERDRPVRPESLDPLLGRDFGGVRVERILGSGGMGRVYLGTDAATGTRVALKVLLRTQRDDAVRRRFDRESRLLERLRHPGIAAVLRSGMEHDADVDVPYIVMEYVDGVRNLSDHVFRERLGVRETVEAFLQACDALAHAHREGYIHRDIKPQNVLVDRHGRVKVIDFGVARAISVDPAAATVRTETGQIVGTMQYMSPEQFLADPRGVDARTDVYALCAVLYELLTGVQPHDLRGLPVHEAARTVCETDAADVRECNARIDDRLAAIVMDGLSREKSRRPDDAAALGLRLRGWLSDGGTTAMRMPDDVAAAPRGDRPQVLVGAAGAVRVDAPRRPVPKAARGGLGWGLTALLVVLVAGSLAVAFGWVDLRAITSRVRGGPGAGPVEAGAADAGTPAAAAKVMDFRVIASAPGASVRVDGAERGRAPAVVLLPQDGRPHEVEVSAEGFGTWRGAWRQGDPPVVAANLEPTADVDSLVRLLVLDVGALPRGAMLRLASKLACEPPPGIGGLQPGITCVTVPFTRSGNGAPWQPADALVLQAVRADGTPAEIEFGAMRAMGEVRPALTPQDASARVRVRVH